MYPVTQASIFSGRWHCVERVVSALLAIDYPDLQRLWLVNGDRPLEDALPGWVLPPTTMTGLPVLPQMPTDGTVRRAKKWAIAEAWILLLAKAGTERDLLFVEDDIVPPPDALAKLQETAYALPAGMVSGLTQTNTGGWPFYVTDPMRGQFVPVQTRLTGVAQVVIAGTFCCYIRRDVLRRMAAAGYQPQVEMRPALPLEGKDCHLGVWLAEQRFAVAVRGDVVCEHHVRQPDGKVKVWPQPK